MDMAMVKERNERVMVYVDGFNIYFGMLEAGYSQCKWLNLKSLAESLLKSGQDLMGISEPMPVGVFMLVQVPAGTYFQALPW